MATAKKRQAYVSIGHATLKLELIQDYYVTPRRKQKWPWSKVQTRYALEVNTAHGQLRFEWPEESDALKSKRAIDTALGLAS